MHAPMLKRRNDARRLAAQIADERRKAQHVGFRSGHEKCMSERELWVTPTDGAVMLNDPPKRDHVIVPVMARRHPLAPIDMDDPSWALRSFPEERVVFRAMRKCFMLPNGQPVEWWDWEPRR